MQENNHSANLWIILLLIISISTICFDQAVGQLQDEIPESSFFDQSKSQHLISKRVYDFNNDNINSAILLDQLASIDKDIDFNSNNKLNDDNEIYVLEDKDYPKSLFEGYAGAGQVSGIATLPSGDIAIFHRSDRVWDEKTFNPNNNSLSDGQAQDNLIKNDTIMILDGDDGASKLSFGSNLFYMPHGITSDSKGNLWVTDVGRHQVMRLPTSLIHLSLLGANASQAKQLWLPGHLSRLWPDIIMGEAFVPGEDEAHFCKPSEVVVSSNDRLVFIADGYCNQRIMVFTSLGQYLTSFGQNEAMNVVHSLTLIEERNMICAADRDNSRILCYKAGLDGDLSTIGELVLNVDYPIGRVFAITSLSSNHLLVSSNQIGTNKYDFAALDPFNNMIKQIWTSSDLLNPHSLARTKDGRYVYAADISREAYKKVFKFYIFQQKN